jgi:thiol-disulfide isomerase/thioredoxin
MKSISLVFFFIFLALKTMIGQKAEEAKPRYYFQQKYIQYIFDQMDKKPIIDDTLQLDKLFSDVNKSWKTFVKDSLSIQNCKIPVEALSNLDAYSYYLTLASITRRYEQKKDIEYHLFKYYMLPSLINDYQYIKTNPSLSNLKLIWAGSLSNTLLFGAKYFDNTETFRSFYNLYNKLKELLNSFQNSDEETKTYVAKLRNILLENGNEIETKNYLFNNHQDIAYGYFITCISTNKYPVYRIYSLADIFLKYYLAKGESDKCLTILNNLFHNTTNDVLPRDTLSKWYTIVDPVNGTKIYTDAIMKYSNNYFKTDEKPSILLPKKWNWIINSMPEEKIKKAKYILIDIWYSSCTPCIAEIPKLNEFYSLLHESENIVFISVNSDFSTIRKDSSFVITTTKNFNVKFPVFYDNKHTNFTKQFNVTGFPAKFIINNQGQIISKEDGSSLTLSSFYDFIKINR